MLRIAAKSADIIVRAARTTRSLRGNGVCGDWPMAFVATLSLEGGSVGVRSFPKAVLGRQPE
jgi:hypothetical protein